MSELLPKKLPFSPKEDQVHAAVTNRVHRQWILSILREERKRIHAWNQIQKKKKDGQYQMREGKYLKVGSDPICSYHDSFILEYVLMLLEMEEGAAKKWQEVAYVINCGIGNGSHTFYVIDTADHVVIATIDAGKKNPSGVAITPDGKKVYVTNWGSDTAVSDNVSVIDTANRGVIATIHVGKKPSGVAITSDGTKVYVTNCGSDTVSVIAIVNNAVIATIPVERSPYGVAITPDGTKVYVTNSNSNTVSVIDTANDVVMDTIPVGGSPHRVAITPDGTKVYVMNSFSVSVIYDHVKIVTILKYGQYGQLPLGIAIGKRLIWQF
jgi:YVTN family beta-propeller protein